MGKSKPQQEVTEYRVSIHYGICAGPVDALFEALIAEKSAWTGSLTYLQAIDINKPNLFGGVKKEGGVGGTLYYLPGEAEQLMPARLAAKFSVPDGLGGTMVGTPETMPAYRGMASAFMLETAGAKRKGFYWTANNPYLRGTWFTVGRGSVARGEIDGLTESIARLYLNDPIASQDPGFVLSPSGGYSSGYPHAWDANGKYIAHIGQGVAVSWNTETETEHAYDSPGNNLIDLGSCHITDSGQIVFRTGGNFLGWLPTYLKFYNGATYVLEQTILLDTYMGGSGLNSGFAGCDIVVGDMEYFVLRLLSPAQPWMVLRRSVGETTWAVYHYAAPATAHDIQQLSVGLDYAYGLKAADRTGILRYNWHTDSESFVIPDSLGSRSIRACGYIKGTDEVVILCTNGDLLAYSPDLSILLRSATGNSANLGLPEIASKRMSISSSAIALPQRHESSPQYVEFIHIIDASSFEFLRTIDVQNDTSFVLKSSTGMNTSYVNQSGGGVFIAATASTANRWWPFTGSGKFDSNPAHMIYESLLNPDWGMGASAASIDKASFEAAAAVLYAEGFGLSMIWLRQTTIEAFVTEILDHIEANLFINPRTGLITIKLIRGDYDVDDLPVFDTTNSTITNFKRKLWGETVNELVVTWTNPANEQEETITVQDDANIASQNGEIVSDGRNYYGIRNSTLATSVGYRDLRVASSPLATCDIEIDRSAWALLPGDVCKIVSPDDGITLMVMRVGPIDYGRIGSPQIRAALVEDVFALATAEYGTPPGSAHEDTDEEPEDAAFAQIITLPYYFAANMLDAGGTIDTEYPTVYAGLMVAQDNADTYAFELWGELTDAGGTIYETELGERSILSRGVLAADLIAEAETTIATWPAGTQGEGPTTSGFAILGSGDDALDEIVFIVDDNGVGGTIRRGVLDTVPRDWPAGTPIWYISPTDRFHDNEPRAAAEEVTYKALTKTSLGVLDPNAATPIVETLIERPHMPLRPVNVEIAGVGFGPVNAEGLDPIPATWSNRNRLTEDALVLAWDDATVTPEVDQLTRITIYNMVDDSVVTVHDDLPGEDFDIPLASVGGLGTVRVKVEAVRDGIVSLQGFELIVTVHSGYGYGYGLNYGGA